jgi:hypothetical protein
MLKRFFYIICSIFFCLSSVYANDKYYLCGPDEDGCSSDEYAYCLCMPEDGALATQPYCLDLIEVSCKPLSLSPQCASEYIFKNQASCLATAFQSEPEPPCAVTNQSFCIKNHIPICEQDAGQATCHAS